MSKFSYLHIRHKNLKHC